MAPKTLFSRVLRALAVQCVWGSVLGSIFYSTAGGPESILGWLGSVAFSTLYAVFIGIPATVLFFALGPRLRRIRPAFQVLAYLGALMPVAAMGCVAADAVFVLARWRTARGFVGQLGDDLRVVLIIAIVTAVAILLYERLRERLEDTQRKLEDQELARERALRLAADARLSSLESRMRPHFLFNALNAVLALIPEDARRAEEALERLTAVLRASLRTDPRGVVPLRDELALARDYLEVERVRFEARLKYSMDVDDAVDADVPAFSVQTLVENSVKYAVAARREGATIRVLVNRDGDLVAVAVEDDGPGLLGAALPEGHGLDTVRGRLAALFGARGTMEIDRSAKGARVVLRVPAKTREAAA